MATPLHVPEMPGVEDLWTLLRFLEEPDEVEAYLEQVREVTRVCEARIAEVGVVGKAEELIAKAQADRQEASEMRALALKDANALKATALEERDLAVAEAAKIRQDLASERAALEEAIAKAARNAREQELMLAARETAVVQNGAAAAQQMREARALKDEFESRLTRLKAATADA